MNQSDYLWAKTSEKGGKEYHPLLLHLLDIAACADLVLDREPASTRERMADILGLDWMNARPWLLLLIACHDFGKACPGFQLKWNENGSELLAMAGLHTPRLPNTDIHHAYVSQYLIETLLIECGWPNELSRLCAEAIGCHHGIRATPTKIECISGDRNGVDEYNWKPLWRSIFSELCQVLNVGKSPWKNELTGPEFMLLAGLTSFTDWIGSNEEWFNFGTVSDCKDLNSWFENRRKRAAYALDTLGWHNRLPLCSNYISFKDAFPKCIPPRPLQSTVAEIVSKATSPCALLIEAPMGEGKTEAAFYAYLELQRRFGHRGLYVAMPTKATGNAMFLRTLNFLKSFSGNKTLDLQLLHGAALLNDTFQNIRLGQMHDEETGNSVQAGEWFTNKKRALLSEYGVGTIDQALLTILPVKHYFVRLWGLANRVVIFDEIHSYDAYTGTLLFHLIRWLRALGSSVILLSATLTPEFRRKLAATLGTTIHDTGVEYPRVTLFDNSTNDITPIHFSADANRKRQLTVKKILSSIESVKEYFNTDFNSDGYAGVILNTVQRAQDLYCLFGTGTIIVENGIVVGKKLSDTTEVYLLHARFPANERQKREDVLLGIFGKNEVDGKLQERSGRKILIATQVVEQSLDLDFDLMVTDLAPIDLILQRAGRIWRHNRNRRPVCEPVICIAGLEGVKAGSFGDPLWWDYVYKEDILLKTWEILHECEPIVLPDHIDTLVTEVYENFSIPEDEELFRRIESAEIAGYGEVIAEQTMAHQAIIGLPDDASWQNTTNFYLYDDDEPGIHPSLLAKTRMGTDSITAVPLLSEDNFDLNAEPDFLAAKQLALRAVTLSRKNVLRKLRSLGIPECWQQTPLLRNNYPMIFNEDREWIEDTTIKLDKELGIVYTHKEA